MLNYCPNRWDVGILCVCVCVCICTIPSAEEKKIRREWCPDKLDQRNMISCFGLVSIELIMEVNLFSEK